MVPYRDFDNYGDVFPLDDENDPSFLSFIKSVAKELDMIMSLGSTTMLDKPITGFNYECNDSMRFARRRLGPRVLVGITGTVNNITKGQLQYWKSNKSINRKVINFIDYG